MHKVFLPSDLQKSGGKAVIYCFADPLRRPAVYARKGLFRYLYKRILAFLIYKKARKPWFQGLWALLSGLPGAIRTRGLSLRRRTLYPTELQRHLFNFWLISWFFGTSACIKKAPKSGSSNQKEVDFRPVY